MKTNEESIRPTNSRPVSDQSKNFEKNFSKTMSQVAPNAKLNEIDGLLGEAEQSLKKKIFSLAKMEALVFADPKLSQVYDDMAENGEEKYGYHYNETIQNMIFNDYVLNSPKYLQKYKMAIPKEKKRRDKSGINQLKKAGDITMHHKDPQFKVKPPVVATDETTGAASAGAFAPALGYEKRVEETTTSASSGAYSGPAAWGSGDLMKGGKSKAMRKPIWQGGTIIGESNYITDPRGFESYVKELNEEFDIENPEVAQKPNVTPYSNAADNNKIIDKTAAFSSNTVKQWDKPDTKLELHTVNSGTMDEPNNGIDEIAKSKAQQRLFGMAHAVQKGTLPAGKVGGAVKKIAKSVSSSDVEDFASTKHKNLPEKINEIEVNEYILTVKHDKGTVRFKTSASSEEEAKNKIMKHEGCPRSAIIKTEMKNKMNTNETAQSIIDDQPDTMANKMGATGTQSSGNVPMGMTDTGMNENLNIFEELNNELNAYSIYHNKLMKMSEDKKPSSLVMKDRLGAENQTNFKKDLQHSGTKEIIDVEKELMWKDQQTDVGKDPQKLNQDIEKAELKNTKGEAFKNVGNSTNDNGDEVPKRNMTTAEQDEVNMYRKGQHSLVYDNKPDKRFEDRMKADMGDKVYEIREKQMAEFGKAPMYNKDPQPIENTTAKKVQFDKEQSGWNELEGLKESMISGRYRNDLNKSHIFDFTLNEVKVLKADNKLVESLFELDFTGLGNAYNSKSHDNKVSVNEGVVKALSSYKYYTNGKEAFAVKNPTQKLNENVETAKPILNEQMDKMKHLLGYKPETFTNTNNVKKNRGF